jgi:hypothetical protein
LACKRVLSKLDRVVNGNFPWKFSTFSNVKNNNSGVAHVKGNEENSRTGSFGGKCGLDSKWGRDYKKILVR